MLLNRRSPLATRSSTLFRTAAGTLTLGAVLTLASFTGVKRAAADDQQAAKTNAQEPQAVLDELNRREKALKDQFEKQLIIVDGKPTNANDIHKKFEAERAELRAQFAKDHPQIKSGEPTQPDPNDPDLSIEERMRLRRYAANTSNALGGEARRQAIAAIPDLSDRQIGMVDAHMEKLLAQRDALESNLASDRNTLGPTHVNIKQEEAQLDFLNKRISDYAIEWRDLQKKLAANNSPALTADPRRPAPGPLPDIPNQGRDALANSSRVSGVQLDVVQLGNAIVDATGAMQLAKVNLEKAERARQQGAAPDSDIEAAKVNLITADKRFKLLRGIAEVALKGAQDELNIATEQYKRGMQTAQGMQDLKSKVQMLEMIIAAGK